MIGFNTQMKNEMYKVVKKRASWPLLKRAMNRG